MSPESAPNALFTNLLQCNAYAISLLYYLLSDASGLDWFHAAYALMLALSVSDGRAGEGRATKADDRASEEVLDPVDRNR